jgi:hypothetical protein
MMTSLALPIASYGYASVLFFVFIQDTDIPFLGAAVAVSIAASRAAQSPLSYCSSCSGPSSWWGGTWGVSPAWWKRRILAL